MSARAATYRPWRGRLLPPWSRVWPIARAGFVLTLRRPSFWIFVGLGLLNFLFHSALIYFLTQVRGRILERGQRLPPQWEKMLRSVTFEGNGESYRDFIFFQNVVLMLLLAFVGALLIGGDFRHGSLAFYLSKPIERRHYFFGKLATVWAIAAGLTLAPALALFVEYGLFSDSIDYWREHLRVLGAIAATGCLVSLACSLLILGVAAWFRRTVPILLVWAALFIFLPSAGNLLRGIFRRLWGEERAWPWGLLDFWSNLRWIANAFFGIGEEKYSGRMPWSIAIVLALCGLAVAAFFRRARATEVVR